MEEWIEFIKNNAEYYAFEDKDTLILNLRKKKIDLLNELPSGNTVELSFTIQDSYETFSTLEELRTDIYSDNDTVFNVRIKFYKSLLLNQQIENCYVFTNLKAVVNTLKEKETWKLVANPEKKLRFFLLFEQIEVISNDFIEILNYSELCTSIAVSNSVYQKYIIFKDLADGKLIRSYLDFPTAWIFDNSYEVLLNFRYNVLDTFFKFISNKSLEDNLFKIQGYKTIDIKLDAGYLIPDKSISQIISLLDFLLENQRFQDKLLILRNVFTMFLLPKSNTQDVCEVLPEVCENVAQNYNTYIQEKIESFLTLKTKLTEEYIATARKTADFTSNILTRLRETGVSLIAVVMLSLLKDIKFLIEYPVIRIMYGVYLLINIYFIFEVRNQNLALLKGLAQYEKDFSRIFPIAPQKENKKDETLNIYVREDVKNFNRVFLVSLLGLLILLLVDVTLGFDCFKEMYKKILIFLGR